MWVLGAVGLHAVGDPLCGVMEAKACAHGQPGKAGVQMAPTSLP